MGDPDGTCGYVLDPDDPELGGPERRTITYLDEDILNEDGVWSCPHDSEDGADLCIFHLPLAEKDDEAVIDAFVDVVETAARRTESEDQAVTLRFLGAKLGSFSLAEECTVTARELDFTCAVFDGAVALYLDSLDVEQLRFRGAVFEDSMSMGGTCGGAIDFWHAEFRGKTRFENVTFERAVDFRNAEFRGDNDLIDTAFDGTEFAGRSDFTSATFEGMTEFRRTEFVGSTEFWAAEFNGATSFQYATFRESASFRDIECTEGMSFSDAHFEATATFIESTFHEPSSFEDARFEAGPDFRDTTFAGTGRFEGAEFDDGGRFTDATLEGAVFAHTDLTDLVFIDADLRAADLESAFLSRTTLFGADLRGAKLFGAALGDAAIDDDTTFLGHPRAEEGSPHTFAAIRRRHCCVYDPAYEPATNHADLDKARSVYRMLEELGRRAARSRLQARCFVRRQDLQKKDYWDDAVAPGASPEERFIAGARWSRAKAARATLLYGESPWRVIAWSLGIVLSFALLYPLGGWIRPAGSAPITYAQIASDPAAILNTVYYSTLTYTALGFGDFQPVGLGRLLTTVETGLGAVLLALLVFILGRRAAR